MSIWTGPQSLDLRRLLWEGRGDSLSLWGEMQKCQRMSGAEQWTVVSPSPLDQGYILEEGWFCFPVLMTNTLGSSCNRGRCFCVAGTKAGLQYQESGPSTKWVQGQSPFPALAFDLRAFHHWRPSWLVLNCIACSVRSFSELPDHALAPAIQAEVDLPLYASFGWSRSEVPLQGLDWTDRGGSFTLLRLLSLSRILRLGGTKTQWTDMSPLPSWAEGK